MKQYQVSFRWSHAPYGGALSVKAIETVPEYVLAESPEDAICQVITCEYEALQPELPSMDHYGSIECDFESEISVYYDDNYAANIYDCYKAVEVE